MRRLTWGPGTQANPLCLRHKRLWAFPAPGTPGRVLKPRPEGRAMAGPQPCEFHPTGALWALSPGLASGSQAGHCPRLPFPWSRDFRSLRGGVRKPGARCVAKLLREALCTPHFRSGNHWHQWGRWSSTQGAAQDQDKCSSPVVTTDRGWQSCHTRSLNERPGGPGSGSQWPGLSPRPCEITTRGSTSCPHCREKTAFQGIPACTWL